MIKRRQFVEMEAMLVAMLGQCCDNHIGGKSDDGGNKKMADKPRARAMATTGHIAADNRWQHRGHGVLTMTATMTTAMASVSIGC